jgi:transcriptional regulator with XRE-family HTH domain|nr:MAG TPA: helix-turn-helix domain protein [Caudoviricetes sp.]
MIAQNLAIVRKNINSNAASFAKEVGIPYTTFIKYERGERKPSFELLEYLVDVYNVNLNYIFSGQGQMFIKPDDNTLERQNDTTVKERVSHFGERLAELQDKHEYLDKDMAKLLSISEEEYIDLKLDDKEPDFKILVRLKQCFKVSIDWLLFGD